MSAVAIATPDMTVPVRSRRVWASIPATPPKKGDKYVVGRGTRSRQQFALSAAMRRYKEINGRGDNAHYKHPQEVARSDFFSSWKSFIPMESPMPIIGPMSGGYQHRTDDDCRRVYVQSERGDERGADEHPQVRPAELHSFVDARFHLRLRCIVLAEVEAVTHVTEKNVLSVSCKLFFPFLSSSFMASNHLSSIPSSSAARVACRPARTMTNSPLSVRAPLKWAATSSSLP